MERITIAGATLAVSPSTLRALEAHKGVRDLVLTASAQLDECTAMIPELREQVQLARKKHPYTWEVPPKAVLQAQLVATMLLKLRVLLTA